MAMARGHTHRVAFEGAQEDEPRSLLVPSVVQLFEAATDEHAPPVRPVFDFVDLEGDVRPATHESDLPAGSGVCVDSASGAGIAYWHDVGALGVAHRHAADAMPREDCFTFFSWDLAKHGSDLSRGPA
jgi:hypothetical protein